MKEEHLTYDELIGVVRHTIQKIKNYPESCKKDMSYFRVLFPDELDSYLKGREINRMSQTNTTTRRCVQDGHTAIS